MNVFRETITSWTLLAASALACVTMPACSAADGQPRAAQLPKVMLPTIHFGAENNMIAFSVIKNDGTVWERTTNKSFTFGPPREIPQAKGARAFGDSILSLDDGGFLTRQPFPDLAPGDGWIRVPATSFEVSSGLPVAGEHVVRMIFPDLYLLSGGTLIQRDAAFGVRPATGPFSNHYVSHNVAQFGIGETALTALLGDGSLVSISRGATPEPDCLARNSVASISVAPSHGAAVMANGSVEMWGDLSLGQLGKAGAAGSRPTQVPSLKNITQVALSEHLSVIAVAVDREGHVWSWGSLGPTEFLPPRRVPGLDNVVYVDYDIVGFALKSDGTAWVFWPPVGNFDPPQQIFSGVKAPETMLVPAPAMPCQSIAMPARRKDPPSQQQTPSPVQLPQQDPPLPGKKDPQADKTAPPPQGPERRPFVIVGRYTCHDKGDRPAGDVTVTTRSAVSCADAHAQQEKVRQSKGGDFCAAANSEHRTSGSPTFTQMGPC